ncbi:prepilin peptidase [Levilactobacillus acidifarinae]|uniref:prepilin peptidase n=1 Tax=Levilactobacillus acidifarinae TaxID=267364 RepID=UPI0007088E97|nr:A24 family peptidase [Levilactobacillus acidifarinae]GEO68747.1 prepilin peptidase [Levilactobacillus acidifarinae]
MLTIILFIYGCCLGSFLCAAASRYATGESLLLPASHCDWCRTPLAYWQLIPGLSYWCLRGRCAYCRTPIPIDTVLAELGGGLLLATWQGPASTQPLAWLFLWSFAALCDARTQSFPAWVGVVNLLLAPHPITVVTTLGLILAYALIRWGWPYWQHPWIGDGDLEFISSFGLALGPLTTSRWLSLACVLALLAHWQVPQKQLPFIPALTISAWIWWVLPGH